MASAILSNVWQSAFKEVTGAQSKQHATRHAANGHGVWGWGSNQYGQLGWPISAKPHLFGRMPFDDLPSGLTIRDIAAGDGHTVLLASDGSVWACGCNYFGQAGMDPRVASVVTSVTRVQGISGVVTDIAAGWYHSLARTSEGKIFSWGLNVFGQLGNGARRNSYVAAPVLSGSGATLTGARRLAAGCFHSLACLDDGSVVAWGDNSEHQVGAVSAGFIVDDLEWPGSPWPLPVQASQEMSGRLTNIAAVAAGDVHSLALSVTGEVFAWGNNLFGQLGRPLDCVADDYPALVRSPTGACNRHLHAITHIAAGALHNLALIETGHIVAWGDNRFGQLGCLQDDISRSATPLLVPNHAFLEEIIYTNIAAGYRHSLALGGTQEGQQVVYGWGSNDEGQLGEYAPVAPSFPVLASSDLNGEFAQASFSRIAAGRDFSLALQDAQ